MLNPYSAHLCSHFPTLVLRHLAPLARLNFAEGCWRTRGIQCWSLKESGTGISCWGSSQRATTRPCQGKPWNGRSLCFSCNRRLLGTAAMKERGRGYRGENLDYQRACIGLVALYGIMSRFCVWKFHVSVGSSVRLEAFHGKRLCWCGGCSHRQDVLLVNMLCSYTAAVAPKSISIMYG